MNEIPSHYLQRLQIRLGEVAYQLTRLKVASLPIQRGWCPPVNAFQSQDEFIVCVDLAGVDRSAMEVQVEADQILLRGYRTCPGPEGTAHIVAMEIDHGPFEREVPLPAGVKPGGVRAEQREGILWIILSISPRTQE